MRKRGIARPYTSLVIASGPFPSAAAREIKLKASRRNSGCSDAKVQGVLWRNCDADIYPRG